MGKFFVLTRKTLFTKGESPKVAPISLDRFRLPSAISDFLRHPSEKCVVDGTLTLIQPRFENIHEPILLGKLKAPHHGPSNTFENEVDKYLKVYNPEGVSFPLGKYFLPSGFGHTLFLRYTFKKSEISELRGVLGTHRRFRKFISNI